MKIKLSTKTCVVTTEEAIMSLLTNMKLFLKLLNTIK